jgi:hypothetical protein
LQPRGLFRLLRHFTPAIRDLGREFLAFDNDSCNPGQDHSPVHSSDEIARGHQPVVLLAAQRLDVLILLRNDIVPICDDRPELVEQLQASHHCVS